MRLLAVSFSLYDHPRSAQIDFIQLSKDLRHSLRHSLYRLFR